ncbi:McrC family protein [Halobacteria archaeon HArc-gm2]|nr:McrC family protein [Halobacteria archaeon HArc-gm2]
MTEITSIGKLGPLVTSQGRSETHPPSDPLSLAEHETSDPFPISDADAEFLKTLGTEYDPAPLTVSFTSDGEAFVGTGSYVGVLTLPSGVQIEIAPKQTVTRLLWALQYAFDTPVDSPTLETELAGASSFFDVIGVLFQAELQQVLNQGLNREYTRTQDVRKHVQGRITVQRQLQRPTAVTTDFAVEYDEFTADNLLNQSVLAAVCVLLQLVNDETLLSRLRHQEQRLREFVSVKPISLASVDRIELSRLNDHYETLLELTKTVLARDFFEDITAGDRRSLALFVNMNEVFERIVERAFRNAATTLGGLTVSGQASIPNIVEGPHAVSMRPDVLVERTDGSPVTVLDAKWKTGSVSSGDVYQLTSYILALGTPGALIYPAHSGRETGQSRVDGEFPLQSVELATNAAVTSFDDYAKAIERSARVHLETVV